jgi:hypothetical protein
MKYPKYRGPLFGDDFLLVRDTTQRLQNNLILDDFLVIGAGKWRPASTPLLLELGRQSGFSFGAFHSVNVFLLTVLTVTCICLMKHVTGSYVVSCLVGLVVQVSQFSWYARSSTYGLMELLPIIYIFCALYLLGSILSEDMNFHWRPIAVWILLLLSSLTHERFLVVVAAFWAVSTLLARRHRQFAGLAMTLIAIPAFHVVSKGIFLGLDPLTGGGESTVPSLFSLRTLHRLAAATIGIFGHASGAGYYFEESTYAQLVTKRQLTIVPIASAIAILIGLVMWMSYRVRQQERTFTRIEVIALTAVLSGILLLYPAATVTERMEGRWLLAPQILIIVGLTGLFFARSSKEQRGRFRWVIALLPTIAIAVGLYYRSGFDDYVIMRTQVENSISKLTSVAPHNSEWFLVVHQHDDSLPEEWQFGYGGVTNQMEHPPYQVVFSSRCPTLRRRIPCLILELSGASSGVRVRALETFVLDE